MQFDDLDGRALTLLGPTPNSWATRMRRPRLPHRGCRAEFGRGHWRVACFRVNGHNARVVCRSAGFQPAM